MLSSATEAEDLVQEVWLRWQMCDRSVVVNPAAQRELLATFIAAAHTVQAVLTVSASAEGIDQVLWMLNPGKIAAVSVPA